MSREANHSTDQQSATPSSASCNSSALANISAALSSYESSRQTGRAGPEANIVDVDSRPNIIHNNPVKGEISAFSKDVPAEAIAPEEDQEAPVVNNHVEVEKGAFEDDLQSDVIAEEDQEVQAENDGRISLQRGGAPSEQSARSLSSVLWYFCPKCSKNIRHNHWKDHRQNLCKLSPALQVAPVTKEKRITRPWKVCKCHGWAIVNKRWAQHCATYDRSPIENIEEELTKDEYQRRLQDDRIKKPSQRRTRTVCDPQSSYEYSQNEDDLSLDEGYSDLRTLGTRLHNEMASPLNMGDNSSQVFSNGVQMGSSSGDFGPSFCLQQQKRHRTDQSSMNNEQVPHQAGYNSVLSTAEEPSATDFANFPQRQHSLSNVSVIEGKTFLLPSDRKTTIGLPNARDTVYKPEPKNLLGAVDSAQLLQLINELDVSVMLPQQLLPLTKCSNPRFASMVAKFSYEKNQSIKMHTGIVLLMLALVKHHEGVRHVLQAYLQEMGADQWAQLVSEGLGDKVQVLYFWPFISEWFVSTKGQGTHVWQVAFSLERKSQRKEYIDNAKLILDVSQHVEFIGSLEQFLSCLCTLCLQQSQLLPLLMNACQETQTMVTYETFERLSSLPIRHRRLMEGQSTVFEKISPSAWESTIARMAREQEQRTHASIDMNQPVEHYLSSIMVDGQPGQFQNIEKGSEERVRQIQNDLSIHPNNMQLALSRVLASFLASNDSYLVQLNGGFGKSFIIVTVALHWLASSAKHQVTVCTSSEILVKDYERQYAGLLGIFGSRITFKATLPQKKCKGLLLLLDEADYFIFEFPKVMQKTVGSRQVIAFSATFGSNEGTEASFCKSLNFKLLTIGLAHALRTPSVDCYIGQSQMLEKIQEEQKLRPVLVFSNSHLSIDGQLTNVFEPRDNSTDLDKLTQLESQFCQTTQKHVVVSIKDEDWMRGINYRSPGKGIALFLVEKFSSERSWLQALNRVGRFGDPSKRYCVRELCGVDQAQKGQKIKAILEVMAQGE